MCCVYYRLKLTADYLECLVCSIYICTVCWHSLCRVWEKGLVLWMCLMVWSVVSDLTLSFINPRLLDDVSFHPCIRYKRWEVRLYRLSPVHVLFMSTHLQAERVLSFIPPDGPFKLLSYQIGNQRYVYTAWLEGFYCTNISYRPLPLPPSIQQCGSTSVRVTSVFILRGKRKIHHKSGTQTDNGKSGTY